MRAERLSAVLPGVYAAPGSASDPVIRMRAAMLRHRDAVLLQAAAARLSFWPEVDVDLVEVAAPQKIRPHPGYEFCRRRIPPELVLVRSGVRLTNPALTAIDLAPRTDADRSTWRSGGGRSLWTGCYEALRLTPNRAGNVDRRRILVDSRERAVVGGRTPSPPPPAPPPSDRMEEQLARVDRWPPLLLDIAFRARRLAVEIDGRLHEDDDDLFESDRWRQNALVMEGWDVLRFTWAMLRDHPDVVLATIRGRR